jgi:hypothetical protein
VAQAQRAVVVYRIVDELFFRDNGSGGYNGRDQRDAVAAVAPVIAAGGGIGQKKRCQSAPIMDHGSNNSYCQMLWIA